MIDYIDSDIDSDLTRIPGWERYLPPDSNEQEFLLSSNAPKETNPYLGLLNPGEVFKSRTALCARLGEKYPGGNSTDALHKKWTRYFSFERPPHENKYIIHEVYDTPLPKPMRASNSNLKDLDKLICYLLYNGQLKNHNTYLRLASTLGLVNKQFWAIYNGYYTLQTDVPFDPLNLIYQPASSVFRIPENQSQSVWNILIRAMANAVYSSLRSSLKSTLHRLTNGGFIQQEQRAFVRLHSGGVRTATIEECMLDFERDRIAFEAVDCTCLREVFQKNRFRKYAVEKKKLCSPHDEFAYLYPAFRITPLQKMDLSGFDPSSTYKELPNCLFRRAWNWKSVEGSPKSIFILNRLIYSTPIWDYDAFQFLWDANMPPNLEKDEISQHLDWLIYRENCIYPDFAEQMSTL